MPLGILDDLAIAGRQAFEVGPGPVIVDDPVAPGEHQQGRLVDPGRHPLHYPIDERAGREQAGRRGSKAEGVVGDEFLANVAVGEQGRVAQGDRECLAPVEEIRQGDPQPLAG